MSVDKQRVVAVLACAVAFACGEEPRAELAVAPAYPWQASRPALPPRWVFEPWAWEDDENTQAATLALVDGYLERGLPLGAVIVDSPWEAPGEAGYHSFLFDRERYPDPEAMVARLHERGVRVVVWATGNMVPEAPDYEEACTYGFFVRRVDNPEPCPTTSFWKGSGRASHVDFFDPEARVWWRGLLDRVLDLGVDGFKVDGSDLQLAELGDPIDTRSGARSLADYSAAMYGVFLDQTRLRRGAEGAILARPFAVENDVARWYAPLPANTAGWVGDQERTWAGLEEALHEIFVSARAGYPVVGSDVSGFKGEPPGARLFVRWAQLGALLPLMEVGGSGEHRPWEFGDEALDVYRRFARLHHELVPWFHHLAIRAHRGEGAAVQPLGDGPEAWRGDWRYLLGDDLLVAALDRDVDERDVLLPPGTWRSWWEPTRAHAGGESVRVETPLERYPLFVRSGAVIPQVKEEGVTTLLVFPDFGGSVSERRLHLGPDVSLTVASEPNAGGVRVRLGPSAGKFSLRVHLGGRRFGLARIETAGEPVAVQLDAPSGIVPGDPPTGEVP